MNRHYTDWDKEMTKKHMKKCSALLVTKENVNWNLSEIPYTVTRVVKIKTEWQHKYWCGPGRLEHPSIARGDVKLQSHYRKQFGDFLTT